MEGSRSSNIALLPCQNYICPGFSFDDGRSISELL
jgi:hypothetical protein